MTRSPGTQHALSDAAEARSAHSIGSAVRDAVLVWYAVLGGIPAWAIHLVGLAAFLRFTCNAGDYVWAMHLATAVTRGMTVVAMLLCGRMLLVGTDGRTDESSDTEDGRTQFLGRLGLIIGAAILARSTPPSTSACW